VFAMGAVQVAVRTPASPDVVTRRIPPSMSPIA
jgi:hypothetical protein